MTVLAEAERAEASASRHPRLRPLPGLDGLRAIAVVAVIVYHLDPSWLPGGYLGVDVFFVISGYLITSLVLTEHRQHGTVDLLRFWRRRARRLLPAVIVMLAVVVTLSACFARDALGRLQPDVPASLLYVMNWRLAFGHDSYVASFGRPPLLQHLWSLAVEEQFYLVWPPVLLLLRRRLRRDAIALVALGGAGVSALLMALLYQPGDPSGVYFPTDTHAFGLLIGCALAASAPPSSMTAAVTVGARRVLDQAGAVALAGLLAGLILLGFDSSATYRGGMLGVDLVSAVAVATAAHPASRIGEVLGHPVLRWVGLRSYSLYLWHWPVFELLRPGSDLPWPVPVVDALRLGLTFAAAEASYRWVEQPWRQGRAGPALRAWLGRIDWWARVAVVAGPLAAVSVLLATAPGPDEPAVLAEGATPAAQDAPGTLTGPTRGRPVPVPPPDRSTTSVTATSPAPATTAPDPIAPPDPLPTDEPILAIGDSVMLAASPALSATFGPAITIDAAVGRQVYSGVARLQAYASAGALARYRTVVIDLGTNGRFTASQFDQIASILAGVPHVVFYDVHAARSWAAPDNTVIFDGVAQHPHQMSVVDWNVAAAAPGLLYPDGVHPDPAGAAMYARLLAQDLDAQAPEPAPTSVSPASIAAGPHRTTASTDSASTAPPAPLG
jgi:peptidoglycan/LPS O-acetylase OafA/YrhL